MDAGIPRRTFLGISAIAGLTALAGCASTAGKSNKEDTGVISPSKLPAPDRTENADVVVVGAAGVSGMVAATHAYDCGLNVIAIDKASGFGQTNSVMYGGVFALETPDRLAQPVHVSKKDFFDKFCDSCDSQANFAAVRNMIANSAEVASLVESTCKGFYPLCGPDPVTELIPATKYYASYTCDCWPDDVYGQKRVPYLEKAFSDRGLELRFGRTATSLLFDGTKVYGVRYSDQDGAIVDVVANDVIVCCGGCAQDADLVAEYTGGAQVVGVGSLNNTGDGIRMCRDVGAQKSKNFALDMVEFGGANSKATPSHSYIGQEGPLTLPLAAGLFVNRDGIRFMPEQTLVRGAMFCSDAFVRQGTYYVIIDQNTVNLFSTKPLPEALGAAVSGLNPGMDVAWSGTVLSKLQDQLDKGIEEGWVFKGETAQDLGAAFGALQLAETVEVYNGYCDSGIDEQYYKDAALLQHLNKAPFYAIECVPAIFNTMGGIKVDGFCRPLRDDGSYIPGLFVTGSDADLWSTQYSYGNTCQGFESMSGYLAADICAGNTLSYKA